MSAEPDRQIPRLQDRRAGLDTDGEPREVPGAAWGNDGGRGFLEHTINLGPQLGVMSWVVALAP